jgi:hypothetical protein
MIRPDPRPIAPPPTLPNRRGSFALLALLLPFLGHIGAPATSVAAGEDVLRSELDRLAAALAESVEARVAVPDVAVLESDATGVRIALGSRGGIRSWSRPVLLPPGGSPWIGEVRDADETTSWLGPSANPPSPDPETPPPARGAVVRARLAGVRIGLLWPGDGTAEHGRLAEQFRRSLERALREGHGWTVLPLAAHSDRQRERQSAATAGLDVVLGARFDPGASGLVVRADLFAARRDEVYSEIALPPSDHPEVAAALRAGADSPRRPLPGTHLAWSVTGIPGAVLELFVRRWIWSDVYAVFDDRIEQWGLSPRGLREIDRHDLLELWPPAVAARWPQATAVPVNTWYDEEGEESKVNYALCSNRRPRFLTLNIDRADPDSLWMAVGDGPLDSLGAATDGCFPGLDRVARPAGFTLPADMPETARARLTLEEIVTGPAGVPTRTANGRLQMRKAAVVYYDEPSATLWLSMPNGGARVPGVFGAEMDGYRLGETGPPGLLVTDGVGPGEPDRLLFLELSGDALVRRWTGPFQTGSIVAIDAADRDGDRHEDVVVGVVRPGPDGWLTDIHYLSSATPGPEETP